MKIKIIYSLFGIILLLSNISCKSKKVVAAAENVGAAGISKNQITERYYQTQNNFKTLYLRADIDYQDAKRAQSVSAEIKIAKDKMILVSIKFLGFTVAKALITPDKVQYYEKLGSKYFEGDYSTISEWLGTDLDFQKIQNMILGQPFDDLSKGNYTVNIEGTNYMLKDNKSQPVQKMFTISSVNFALLQQEIIQAQKNRKVIVDYASHEAYSQGILPKNINILATQGTANTSVKIEIVNAKYDEELTFPYSVPGGYSKIEMKK